MSRKGRNSGSAPKGITYALGRRIAELRKGLHLTQAALADEAGLNTKYVGELERGRRDVRITTVARLAKALDVEPHGLFHFAEADQTIAQIGELLHRRDDVYRGHLVRVLREIVLLTDTGR